MTIDLDAEFNAARVRVNRSIGQRVRYAKACIHALVAFELRLLDRRWMIQAHRPVRYVMQETLDRRTARMLVSKQWLR